MSSRSTATPRAISSSRRWPRTTTATSWFPGRASAKMALALASSPGFSRAPAFLSRPSSRSTPTPPAARNSPLWRWRATPASSWFGRAPGRTARPTASSRVASPAPGFPLPPSSRSAPTPRATRSSRRWPRTAMATSSWSGRASAKMATGRRLRAPLHEHGRSRRRRVPSQCLHHRQPAQTRRGGRRDGDFVIVWESLAQDGSVLGVFARRFSSAGNPLASEFQVNTYTTSTRASRRSAWTLKATSWSPGEQHPGRLEHRHLRPPLLERGRSTGRRAAGQHLHHAPPDLPNGCGGRGW